MGWDGIERRKPVTEEETPKPEEPIHRPVPLTADEVITAVVDKAATKVAETATTSNGNGKHSALTRAESLAVVAVLIIMNLAVFFVSLTNQRGMSDHRKDFQVLCGVIVDLTPETAESAQVLRRLAECYD